MSSNVTHNFDLWWCFLTAAVSTLLTYPFDIMRTQFALQGKEKFHNSMYSYISYTMRSHGWKGLFSGIGPSIIGIAPYIGLNFTFYEGLKRMIIVDTKQSTDNQVITVIKTGFIGGVAGGLSKLIVYPLVFACLNFFKLQYFTLSHYFNRIQ